MLIYLNKIKLTMTEKLDDSTLSEENIVNQGEHPLNTDPKNASFTIDDVLNYGSLYEKCLSRTSKDVCEKYFRIFSSNENEKLTNSISPYGSKPITWMTLYSNVIRKIINPFSFKDKEYVTLQEIENRINIVIHTDEKKSSKNKALINKENENFIPKIMRMFTYGRNNKTKKEIENKIDSTNSIVTQKKNSLGVKRRMTTMNIKSKNNTLLNAPSASSSSTVQVSRPRISSMRKLSSFNLDNLQRAYDNHNNLQNQYSSSKNLENITENSKDKFKLRRQSCSNVRLSNTLSAKMLPIQSKKTSSIPLISSSSNYSLKPVKEVTPFEKKAIPLDPYRAFRQIPKMDYKNYIGKSIYKKMDKLAYKDEINDFKHNSDIALTDAKKSNLTSQDKNINNILNLINFNEDTQLNSIDNENDVALRGERIATYKKIADEIYDALILDYTN